MPCIMSNEKYLSLFRNLLDNILVFYSNSIMQQVPFFFRLPREV